MRTIVAGVDFSSVTQNLVEWAERMARAFDAQIYLVHVEAPEPDFVGYGPGPREVRHTVAEEAMDAHRRMERLREALRTRKLDAHGLVVQGPAADKLLEEARRLEADIIMVGNHGHGALRNLVLGSVSSTVMKASPVPVLVVPSLDKDD